MNSETPNLSVKSDSVPPSHTGADTVSGNKRRFQSPHSFAQRQLPTIAKVCDTRWRFAQVLQNIFYRRLSALSVLLFVFLPACESVIPSPTITDSTDPWGTSATNRELRATVNVHPDITVVDVYLRQTRHYWPGTQQANNFSATPVSNVPDTFSVTIPDAETWPKADHVFYEWFFEYRRGQSDIILARSANDNNPHDFVIGCDEAAQLATRTVIGNLRVSFNDNYNLNPAYSAPAHLRPASLQTQGIPFARPGKAFSLTTVTPGAPGLLLFFPPPQTTGETTDAYIERITDIFPDTGSQLAGVGYGVIQNSATRRPRLGCIPSSKWFIHEAGIHTPDGRITLYPVSETVPGATVVNAMTAPANFENAPAGVWHPRIWDLHFWFDAASPGGVVLTENSPTPIPGLAVPDGVFFKPLTFE